VKKKKTEKAIHELGKVLLSAYTQLYFAFCPFVSSSIEHRLQGSIHAL
jgi:hypothetical protein